MPVVVRQWVITSLERTTMPKKSKIGITTLPIIHYRGSLGDHPYLVKYILKEAVIEPPE